MATKKKTRAVSDWLTRAKSKTVPQEIVALIERRRRQMLVHCYIYYRMDDNVISDHEWMRMAQELANLQAEHGTKFGFYDDLFANWDGSSGFQLTYDAETANAAMKLVADRDRRELRGHLA